MTLLPHLLQNGAGNYVDHNKYMDNMLWLFAMSKGNFINNGGFEAWGSGTSFTNPADTDALADEWTLEKGGTTPATADVDREGTTKDSGSYSMDVSISSAGSSDSYLRIKQTRSEYAQLAGQTIAVGIKVKVATASKVRISVTDGVDTEYSEYHDGDGTWQLLLAVITLDAALTELTVKVEITSDFDSDPVYIDSGFIYIIDPVMSQAAREALAYFEPDELLL